MSSLSFEWDPTTVDPVLIGMMMSKNYDFSESKPNPYAKKLKKQVTIRLDEATIEYFKGMAEEAGIPYQTLINLYLRECATSGRKLNLEWS